MPRSHLARLVLRNLLLTSILLLNSTQLLLPQLIGQQLRGQLATALLNQSVDSAHEPHSKSSAIQQYSNLLGSSLSNSHPFLDQRNTFAQTWLRPTSKSTNVNERLSNYQDTAYVRHNSNASNNYFPQDLEHEGSGNGPLNAKHQQRIKFDDTEDGEDDEEDEDDYVDKETFDTGSGMGRDVPDNPSKINHINPLEQASTKDVPYTLETNHQPTKLANVEPSANESVQPINTTPSYFIPTKTTSNALINLLLSQNLTNFNKSLDNHSSPVRQQELHEIDKDLPIAIDKTITTKSPLTFSATQSTATTFSTTTTQPKPTTTMHVTTSVPNSNSSPPTLIPPTLKQANPDILTKDESRPIFLIYSSTQRPRYSKNPILPLAISVPTVSPVHYLTNQNYNAPFPATFKPNLTKLTNEDYNEDEEESDEDFEDSIEDSSIFSDGFEPSPVNNNGTEFNQTNMSRTTTPSSSLSSSKSDPETTNITTNKLFNHSTTPSPTFERTTVSVTFHHSTMQTASVKETQTTSPQVVYKPINSNIPMESNMGKERDYDDKEENEDEDEEKEEREKEEEEEEKDEEEEDEEEEDEEEFPSDPEILRSQNYSITTAPHHTVVATLKPETRLLSTFSYPINPVTSTPQYTSRIFETKQATSTIPTIFVTDSIEATSSVVTETISPFTLPNPTSSISPSTVDKTIDYKVSTTTILRSKLQDPMLVHTSGNIPVNYNSNQQTKNTPRPSIRLSDHNDDLQAKQDPDITQVILDKAVELYHNANSAIHNAVDAVWPPSFEFSTSNMEQLISNPLLFMLAFGAAIICLVLTMMLIVYVISYQIQPRDDISIY